MTERAKRSKPIPPLVCLAFSEDRTFEVINSLSILPIIGTDEIVVGAKLQYPWKDKNGTLVREAEIVASGM